MEAASALPPLRATTAVAVADTEAALGARAALTSRFPTEVATTGAAITGVVASACHLLSPSSALAGACSVSLC